MYVVAITAVEVVAAVTRAERGKRINAADAYKCRTQFRKDLQLEYQVIEVTESIIVTGMTLAETYGLRGYDAIQLAAGCTINTLCISNSLAPVIFVSADKELNIAASSKGLVVDNPNKHP